MCGYNPSGFGGCDHVSNWALQTQLGRPYTRGCSAPVPMFTQDSDKLVIGTPKKQHGIHTLLYKYTISYRIFEGFHKWGYSKRMLCNGKSIYTWMIWGYPMAPWLRKPTFLGFRCFQGVLGRWGYWWAYRYTYGNKLHKVGYNPYNYGLWTMVI